MTKAAAAEEEAPRDASSSSSLLTLAVTAAVTPTIAPETVVGEAFAENFAHRPSEEEAGSSSADSMAVSPLASQVVSMHESAKAQVLTTKPPSIGTPVRAESASAEAKHADVSWEVLQTSQVPQPPEQPTPEEPLTMTVTAATTRTQTRAMTVCRGAGDVPAHAEEKRTEEESVRDVADMQQESTSRQKPAFTATVADAPPESSAPAAKRRCTDTRRALPRGQVAQRTPQQRRSRRSGRFGADSDSSWGARPKRKKRLLSSHRTPQPSSDGRDSDSSGEKASAIKGSGLCCEKKRQRTIDSGPHASRKNVKPCEWWSDARRHAAGVSKVLLDCPES